MDRLKIVSIDQPPAKQVTDAITLMGMTHTSEPWDSFDPHAVNPLAVLVPMHQSKPDRIRECLMRLLEPSLDTGALFVLVADDAGTFEAASELLLDQARKAIGSPVESVSHVYRNAHVLKGEASEIAPLLRSHNPGLPFSNSVALRGAEGMTPQDKALLRRAFSDMPELALSVITGGKSGMGQPWSSRGR